MRNFTIEDFMGAGQYLVRNDKGPNEYTDTSFLTTIMKKVGYCLGHGCVDPPDGNIMTLVDMSDGLTKLGYFDQRNDPTYNDNPRTIDSSTWIWVPFSNKQVLCDYLNNPDLCRQEYRFATNEELVRVANGTKHRTRG